MFKPRILDSVLLKYIEIQLNSKKLKKNIYSKRERRQKNFTLISIKKRD
jgi:hypothetical protein